MGGLVIMYDRNRLFISDKIDRESIAGMLVKAGYIVRLIKIKTDKTSKIYIEYWEEKQ